jgi:hypothetical protein
MMNSTKWVNAIGTAAKEHPRGRPSKRQILATARRLYPREMRIDDIEKADRGQMRALNFELRRVANVDESDPDAPVVQLSMLPGMLAPRYLTTPDLEDGGLSVVPYLKAVMGDHHFAIDERRRQVDKISRRADDLERKLEVLEPHMESEDTTTEEALRRLARSDDAGEAA